MADGRRTPTPRGRRLLRPGAGASIAGQTAVILASRVIGALSTAVLTIALARFLGLQGYGTYAFAITIAATAALVASMGIDSATSRFVADGYNRRRGVAMVLWRGLRVRTVVAAVVFGGLIAVADQFAALVGQPDMGNEIRAASLALFFSAGFQWVTGVYEGVRRGGRLALMSVVKAAVEFVVVLAVLAAGFGVVAALLGNAISYAAAVGVGLLLMRPYMRRRPRGEAQEAGEEDVSTGTILRYGNHIWLAGIAWILFDRVDQFLLGIFIGTDAVGLYDAPWKIASILGLLSLSLASAVTPRVASADPAEAGALVTKALRVAIVAYLVLAAITAVAANDLFVTLLGADFARSADVLVVLVPYLVLIGLAPILSRALDYLGVAAVRKWIALATFLVNLVLDVILIPTVGLLGAAIATDISVLTFVAGHYVLCARRLPLDNRQLAASGIRSLAAAGVGAIACALVLLAPGPTLLLLALAFPLASLAALAVLVFFREVAPEELPAPRWARGLAEGLVARAPDWRAREGVARPVAMLPIAMALAAILVGGLVGRAPLQVLGAAMGLALVALLLSDVTVGVLAFVLIQPLAASSIVGAGEGFVTKALGGILFVTWLMSLRYPAARKRYRSLLEEQPVLVAAVVAFMGWAVTSLLWSLDNALALDALLRWGLSFLLMAIVFTAARDRRSAVLICGAFAVSAALSTVIGAAAGRSVDGRLTGTLADPNEFAAFLVPALLIAGALAATAANALRRLAFAGVALICGVGILLTGSRGGIIAALAALAAWLVFGGRWRFRVLAAAAVIGVVAIAYLNAYADPATRDRVMQVTAQDELASDGGTGRTDIWRVGLRAFDDNPVRGAGVGNYTEATPRYLDQPGLVRRSDFFFETPKVAHNMYLQALVEVGIVGTSLFGLALLLVMRSAVRAARAFRRRGDDQMELLSRSLLAGLVGTLAADFFISGQYQRALWILAGLALAFWSLARTPEPEPEPEPLYHDEPEPFHERRATVPAGVD